MNPTKTMCKAFNRILGIEDRSFFAHTFFKHFPEAHKTVPTAVEIRDFCYTQKPLSGWRTTRNKKWECTRTRIEQIQYALIYGGECIEAYLD